MANHAEPEEMHRIQEESEEESEGENEAWEDWTEEETPESDFVCLFCDSNYNSCELLFDHCHLCHSFDFHGIKKALNLDFYGCFKLINYVRSQVAANKCWSCDNICELKNVLEGDTYLKPVREDDSLLYSFADDDDFITSCDKDEVSNDLESSDTNALTGNGHLGIGSEEVDGSYEKKSMDIHAISPITKDFRKVNERYFGSYSSFGIHREMISDKVRTEAYRQAILENPSVFKGAVVMDVGCGTGILSLFAAQAGASRVIAIEASEKMAAVATQIAKSNGLLRGGDKSTRRIEVVQSMVEEVDKLIKIEPHSIDVLISEWMGYCLLYESMLNSVIFARDKWLKPGGSIFPDTATILVAGFGKGGTSLPFWEDVYGFDMSCIGKELVKDASQIPIIDVVDGRDIVTTTATLQTFDLATMKSEEVDFTACAELQPSELKSKTVECYGVVLWFDTGFNARYCKEKPTVLSTSPYTTKTHWAQTILTFPQPIHLADVSTIYLRISIVRASEYRCLDISLETTAHLLDGGKTCWPVQIFNLS